MPLLPHKQGLIELMLDRDVLKFGEFVTKSGRETPYFINTGEFSDGDALARLGGFYAEALARTLGGEFDNLYGPAYKGIPLAAATAQALAREQDHNVSFTFNRKEAKDHGEKGALVGHCYTGGERVVIVDDVITAGTSVRESVPLIRAAADVQVRAVLVAVDRMETGQRGLSALQEIQEDFALTAFAIVTLDDIICYLRQQLDAGGGDGLDAATLDRVRAYRQRYGCEPAGD